MKPIKTILAGLAAAAVAAAPAALANPVDNPGNPEKPVKPEHPVKPEKPVKPDTPANPTVSYVFKGTYNGDGSVTVAKGNRHVDNAGLTGTSVAFDLADAKLVVADDNGDGTADINDVATGDEVLVTSRLKKNDPGTGPYAAKKLIDKTH